MGLYCLKMTYLVSLLQMPIWVLSLCPKRSQTVLTTMSIGESTQSPGGQQVPEVSSRRGDSLGPTRLDIGPQWPALGSSPHPGRVHPAGRRLHRVERVMEGCDVGMLDLGEEEALRQLFLGQCSDCHFLKGHRR